MLLLYLLCMLIPSTFRRWSQHYPCVCRKQSYPLSCVISCVISWLSVFICCCALICYSFVIHDNDSIVTWLQTCKKIHFLLSFFSSFTTHTYTRLLCCLICSFAVIPNTFGIAGGAGVIQCMGRRSFAVSLLRGLLLLRCLFVGLLVEHCCLRPHPHIPSHPASPPSYLFSFLLLRCWMSMLSSLFMLLPFLSSSSLFDWFDCANCLSLSHTHPILHTH